MVPTKPDPVQEAARIMGVTVESFFWLCALAAGYRDQQANRQAEDHARQWWMIYQRHLNGFHDLPRHVRDYARLKANMRSDDAPFTQKLIA